MQHSIDLRPEQLRQVQSILDVHVPGREVRAFGSRVTGEAKPMSDLDLCIMGDDPLAAEVQDILSTAFSESTLPFKVDVIAWASIGDRFRAAINQGTVVIRTADHANKRAR
jgi:predicted nucleotidyltransferase